MSMFKGDYEADAAWDPRKRRSEQARRVLEAQARADKAMEAYAQGVSAGERMAWSIDQAKAALIGKRIRVTGIMQDDPAPLDVGEEGTVTSIERGIGVGNETIRMMLYVKWDSGRTLKVFIFDPWEIVTMGVGSFVKRAFNGEMYEMKEYDPEGSFRAEHKQKIGPRGPDWVGRSKALVEGGTYEIVQP